MGRRRPVKRLEPVGGAARFGVVVIGCVALLAVFAPGLAPYSPYAMALEERLQGASLAHLLGTDALGRDVLSRLMYGARTSLWVACLSLLWGGLLGTGLGLCSGYFRGVFDLLLMRLMEAVLSIPNLVLAMGIGVALGQSKATLILALGIAVVPNYTLMVRSQVLSLREREFIRAEQILGASHGRILFRHILPNCVSPLIVTTTINLGSTIMAEAGLSFLNLGVALPEASWGNMVNEGFQYLGRAPMLSILPGLMIMLVVYGFHAIGEALRQRSGAMGGR